MSKEWDLPGPVSPVASSLCIPAELQRLNWVSRVTSSQTVTFELHHLAPSRVPSPPTPTVVQCYTPPNCGTTLYTIKGLVEMEDKANRTYSGAQTKPYQ